MSPYREPSNEAKLWVIQQIAKFIHDTHGTGTFRRLIYDYLFLNYGEAHHAGAMTLINSISEEAYKEWVLCESCKK